MDFAVDVRRLFARGHADVDGVLVRFSRARYGGGCSSTEVAETVGSVSVVGYGKEANDALLTPGAQGVVIGVDESASVGGSEEFIHVWCGYHGED